MSDWRVIDWLSGYEISRTGELRRVNVRQKVTGSLVRGHVVKGYRVFRLPNGKGGIRYLLAHRLVCEAFNGPPNVLHREVAHFDGNRLNNNAENLRWVSPAENAADRTMHGTQAGENHPRSRLAWTTVRDIRRNYAGRRGEISALARQHGLHRESMRQIIRGETWKERASV